MRLIGDFKNAIDAYSKALQNDDCKKKETLEKRGLLNYNLGRYQNAIDDFSNVLS